MRNIEELITSPLTRENAFRHLYHNDSMVNALWKRLAEMPELTKEAQLLIMLIISREQYRDLLYSISR
jgi:hypothetical protein